MPQRRVGELMHPKVISLAPDTTVREAEALLSGQRVGGAPVVDPEGRILGIVSQNDLARHVSRRVTEAEAGRFYTDEDDFREIGGQATDLGTTPVEKVMSRRIWSVGRDDPAGAAAQLMREHRIHRVLVTEEERLVGILTSLDLLQIVAEMDEEPSRTRRGGGDGGAPPEGGHRRP